MYGFRVRLAVLVAWLAVLAGACNGGRPAIEEPDDELQAIEYERAVEHGDYATALEIAKKLQSPRPEEVQFAVGYTMLQWLQDKDVRRPSFSYEDSLAYIRSAAEAGLPSAAGTLKAGYEWGWYGLKQDEDLATCWRRVEHAEGKPDDCVHRE